MKNLALLALAFFVNGCDTLTCGAGTQRIGDSCVAIAVDAGSADDAGSDASAPDAVTGGVCPASAAPASDPGVVSCEQTRCTGTDTCSIDFSTGAGSCLPPGSVALTRSDAILRHCDEAADCDANTVCCEVFQASGSWYGAVTTCEQACTFGAPAQACRTDAECGGGMTCRAYDVGRMVTVATCQRPIGCL